MSGNPPVEVASVYLHAPFCARRCFYCDFAVTVRRAADPHDWLRALRGELAALESEGRVRLADPLRTIYVGGGTPSLLGPAAMEGVAAVLGRGRVRGPEIEWTAEANPESLSSELVRRWRAAGVGRLSLGTQSFQDSALRWMGRLHGADGARAAVAAAREGGVPNVSIDLIFGLPATVDRDWGQDLDEALRLDVPHLSLYGLTAESGTPLGRAVSEGRLSMVEDTRYEDEYLAAAERLVAEGYEHYEVSNFARPGHRSRHNEVYWSGLPYLGVGNGAHSYLPPQRRWNVREWADYARLAAGPAPPIESSEHLDDAARRLERVWLGLRTAEGLDPAMLTPAGAVLVDRWRASGLVRPGIGRVALTATGWLVLDRLAVELDRALDRDRVPAAPPVPEGGG